MSYSKTLIYLEEAQLRELRRRARASRRSMASVVREAVGTYLARPRPAPLEGFVACAEGPPGDDASRRTHEILRGILG